MKCVAVVKSRNSVKRHSHAFSLDGKTWPDLLAALSVAVSAHDRYIGTIENIAFVDVID